MKKLRPYKIKYQDDPNGDFCTYYTAKVYVEMYGWHVHIIYSDDIHKVRNSPKFVKVLGEDSGKKYAYAFAETIFAKGNMRSLIFLPWEHKTNEMCPEGIVAHECNHVVWHIHEQLGIKDEEAACYLLQSLVSYATILSNGVKKILTSAPEAAKVTEVAGASHSIGKFKISSKEEESITV